MSSQFEFNDRLLSFLADELHSCKYGNFFYNSEQERKQAKVNEKTFSIWTVVQLHKECVFRNASFAGEAKMRRVTCINSFNSWNLRFWKEFFFQYSEPIW